MSDHLLVPQLDVELSTVVKASELMERLSSFGTRKPTPKPMKYVSLKEANKNSSYFATDNKLLAIREVSPVARLTMNL